MTFDEYQLEYDVSYARFRREQLGVVDRERIPAFIFFTSEQTGNKNSREQRHIMELDNDAFK